MLWEQSGGLLNLDKWSQRFSWGGCQNTQELTRQRVGGLRLAEGAMFARTRAYYEWLMFGER